MADCWNPRVGPVCGGLAITLPQTTTTINFSAEDLTVSGTSMAGNVEFVVIPGMEHVITRLAGNMLQEQLYAITVRDRGSASSFKSRRHIKAILSSVCVLITTPRHVYPRPVWINTSYNRQTPALVCTRLVILPTTQSISNFRSGSRAHNVFFSGNTIQETHTAVTGAIVVSDVENKNSFTAVLTSV